MRKMKLSQGKYAIVDDNDFEWLSQWKWHYGGRGYAVRTINRSEKIYMHRVVLKNPPGYESDHINMDRLDNRRGNLRICTVKQNQRNRGLMKTNTSGFKGVYFRGKYRYKKWAVYIMGKFLGGFENKLDAAKRYNECVREYHGEFARLNKI